MAAKMEISLRAKVRKLEAGLKSSSKQYKETLRKLQASQKLVKKNQAQSNKRIKDLQNEVRQLKAKNANIAKQSKKICSEYNKLSNRFSKLLASPAKAKSKRTSVKRATKARLTRISSTKRAKNTSRRRKRAA